MPPGRGSRVARRPFHRTILSGSMKNENTVSGLAAMRTSRWTTWSLVAATTPSLLSLRFRRFLQQFEVLLPEALQERSKFGNALRSGPVEPPSPLPSLSHQARFLQYPKVLRYGRAGHLEVRGDLARGQLRGPHQAEDLPPPRLGNGANGTLH